MKMLDPKGALWAIFNKKLTREEIDERFRERYGYSAVVIEPTGGGWLAGPLCVGEKLLPAAEHVVTLAREVTE